MTPIFLIDGNNLGHALGYIDKASGRYDNAGLLACLDGTARYLAAQGQEIEMVLFLDDAHAAERLGGWHVRVAPVPGGDADAAIRAYAQAHTDRPQTLVSGDQALCDDVALWGVVCFSPEAFVAHYLVLARRAGFGGEPASGRVSESAGQRVGESASQRKAIKDCSESARGEARSALTLSPPTDRGVVERQRQAATLTRAEATLRGEPLTVPEVYRLDLERWSDRAELALYLAEHHLCPAHPDLTDPDEMMAAIREHCSRQPRYFSAGPVIDRLLRLFLCRPEHTLSLDDLARLGKTRRRKVKAALEKYGERLGIVMVW